MLMHCTQQQNSIRVLQGQATRMFNAFPSTAKDTGRAGFLIVLSKIQKYAVFLQSDGSFQPQKLPHNQNNIESKPDFSGETVGIFS